MLLKEFRPGDIIVTAQRNESAVCVRYPVVVIQPELIGGGISLIRSLFFVLFLLVCLSFFVFDVFVWWHIRVLSIRNSDDAELYLYHIYTSRRSAYGRRDRRVDDVPKTADEMKPWNP